MTYIHPKHKIFLHLSPLALGLLSLFLNIPWHIQNIPFMCYDYLGNIHHGMNMFIWGGTGGDKACGTLPLLVRIILYVRKDSIYMGKHLELTLDRIYILWSIFLSIYALKGNNHTCDYFINMFGILLGLDYLSFSYSCGALYKIWSIFPQAID